MDTRPREKKEPPCIEKIYQPTQARSIHLFYQLLEYSLYEFICSCPSQSFPSYSQLLDFHYKCKLDSLLFGEFDCHSSQPCMQQGCCWPWLAWAQASPQPRQPIEILAQRQARLQARQLLHQCRLLLLLHSSLLLSMSIQLIALLQPLSPSMASAIPLQLLGTSQ